mmetsp:Transcript_107462/g.272673  ORF Transcript_107462/g.272673 Transcript_107462/m.272673 type:complete len:279 (-) Transcript_107462:443-1279(-)|eukprot:CAMPEP_0183411236 /NCGR_PEP_ID=MMETSP0370-20130417/20168_1 /TAXON_ID=268820 /ORGANISM="Peridinium aciculiferum, Strain PAER-2" /LENGTH=278 /DNA_ID=CAMNT_0025594193 /DNA_START=73 /DNA_END=909 /DNA_ORIENTATION=-
MASASFSPGFATCRGSPVKSEKISFGAGGSGHCGEGLQRVPAVSPRNTMRFLCHPKLCVVLGLPPCLAGALSMAAIFALVTCLALQLQVFTACAVVLPDGGSSAVQGQLLQQQDLGSEDEALRWELRNATLELRALLLGLREQHRKSDQVALTKDQVREALARERETLVQRLREALAAESSDAEAEEREALLEALRQERGQEHEDIMQLRLSLFNFTAAQSTQIKDILLEQLAALQDIKLRGSGRSKEKSGLTRGILGSFFSARESNSINTSQDSNGR